MINKKLNSKKGFTIVEMLVVAPIVILVIGAFIAAIVDMTGSVLRSRAVNALTYNVQDSLNRIRQDVTLSGGYLATNNFSIHTPQGFDNDDVEFSNSDSILILNTYATTGNPLSSSRNLVYIPTGPIPCSSTSINKNSTLMFNVVYFVKSDSLWRRVIAPDPYNNGCISSSSTGYPWQKPSCAPSYSDAWCKAEDEKLVDGIGTGGFSIKYFPTMSSATESTAANNGSTTAIRQAELSANNTVEITIDSTNTVAGQDVKRSGTVRAISKNDKH